MSHFFLHNKALVCDNYGLFKDGVSRLIEIKKRPDHFFYRHNSCYDLPYFTNDVYPNFNLPEERALLEFFEKLNSCPDLVECEDTAKKFCSSETNGFLGIDFKLLPINPNKKIVDDKAYENWISHYQSRYDKLKAIFVGVKMSERFKKSFLTCSQEVQEAIIEKFELSVNKNLIKLPDNKLVKNVSVSDKCTVLELRIFSPVALRVYFNYDGKKVNIASIEQKSNPNQNEDIKNAEKLIYYLMNTK